MPDDAPTTTERAPKRTPDEVCRAIMEMIGAISLVYKMDGYVPSHKPDAEPFRVPFASNFDRALDMINAPGIRETLVELLYRDEHEKIDRARAMRAAASTTGETE